jgi:hypothetical protein
MAKPCHAHDGDKYFSLKETPSTPSGSAGSGGGGRRLGGGCWCGGERRIEPADMDAAVQTVLGLGIDMALAHNATESCLDMRAWAAKSVVKVEMAEGGVEVVPPQQADDAAAQPDAFRIAGRPGQGPRGFCDLIGLFLPFLGSIGRRRLLLRRFAFAALGESRAEAADEEKGRKQSGAAMTQDN